MCILVIRSTIEVRKGGLLFPVFRCSVVGRRLEAQSEVESLVLKCDGTGNVVIVNKVPIIAHNQSLNGTDVSGHCRHFVPNDIAVSQMVHVLRPERNSLGVVTHVDSTAYGTHRRRSSKHRAPRDARVASYHGLGCRIVGNAVGSNA